MLQFNMCHELLLDNVEEAEKEENVVEMRSRVKLQLSFKHKQIFYTVCMLREITRATSSRAA